MAPAKRRQKRLLILSSILLAVCLGIETQSISGQRPTCIYVAGPLGFSEAGTDFEERVLLPRLRRLGYEAINPFELADKAKLKSIAEMPPGNPRIEAWKQFNYETGERNRAAIDRCDLVLAILDGPDVDSGTASEIGYAFARNKRIVGYRGDFRLSSDDEGGKVNLQVEYFIRASGGEILTEISQLDDGLSRLQKSSP